MKRTLAAAAVLLLCFACTADNGAPAENDAVARTLTQLDKLAERARQSTVTFFQTEPFSQHAKITFTEAYRDWGEVRFRTRLTTFTPEQLQANQQLRPALSALTAAATTWVNYFETIEAAVEGEAPIDQALADRLLALAKTKDAQAKAALRRAIHETGSG